jgi:hypothetical protein
MAGASVVESLLAVEQRIPMGVCDRDVYEHGEPVLIFAGPRSWLIERWVTLVRERAGVPVDWNFMGGWAVVRAVIRTADDAVAVGAAVADLLPSLREAAALAHTRGDDGAYEITLREVPRG